MSSLDSPTLALYAESLLPTAYLPNSSKWQAVENLCNPHGLTQPGFPPLSPPTPGSPLPRALGKLFTVGAYLSQPRGSSFRKGLLPRPPSPHSLHTASSSHHRRSRHFMGETRGAGDCPQQPFIPTGHPARGLTASGSSGAL